MEESYKMWKKREIYTKMVVLWCVAGCVVKCVLVLDHQRLLTPGWGWGLGLGSGFDHPRLLTEPLCRKGIG